MADKTYRVTNTALLGLNGEGFPGKERITDYQIHPSIRNNWKSADRLRDVYGYVPALWTSIDPDTGTETEYVLDSMFYHISPPFKEVPLISSTSPGGMAASILLGAPLPESSDLPATAMTIRFDQGNWNSFINETYIPVSQSRENMVDFLLQDQPNTLFAGRPYFVKYFGAAADLLLTEGGLLVSDPRMLGATENVSAIMEADVAIGKDIYDHTFDYDLFDLPDPSRGANYGTNNIEINSVYNRFLTEVPNYEAAILSLAEPAIPNYYIREIHRATTPGALPLTSYFEGAVQRVEGANAAELEAQAAVYLENSKNIAVLSPEVATNFLEEYNIVALDNRGTALDPTDDLLAIDGWPFYNEVVIPYTNQYQTVGPRNDLFYELGKVGVSMDLRMKLITLIQLIIIDNYNSPEAPIMTSLTGASVPFTIYDNTYSEIGGKVIDGAPSINLILNLEDLLAALGGNLQGGLGPLYAHSLAEWYDTGQAPYAVGLNPNVRVLKQSYDPGIRWLQENFIMSPNIGTLYEKIAEVIINKRRPLREFYRGLDHEDSRVCDSEPIMYLVEKRIIPPGRLVADLSLPPVQTLFFGKDISNNRAGIRYYDTQIKYGVRYQYDVKQVRLVFGNRYKYTSQTQSIVNRGNLDCGRAVGNALGFFAEEDVANGAGRPVFTQVVNGTIDPNFTYVAEDADTELVEIAQNSGYGGYFIYKWPADTPYNNSIALEQGVLSLPPDDSSTAFGYMEADFSQINLRPRTGAGFDGNGSGGFISGTPPDPGLAGLRGTLVQSAKDDPIIPREIDPDAAAAAGFARGDSVVDNKDLDKWLLAEVDKWVESVAGDIDRVAGRGADIEGRIPDIQQRVHDYQNSTGEFDRSQVGSTQYMANVGALGDDLMEMDIEIEAFSTPPPTQGL